MEPLPVLSISVPWRGSRLVFGAVQCFVCGSQWHFSFGSIQALEKPRYLWCGCSALQCGFKEDNNRSAACG